MSLSDDSSEGVGHLARANKSLQTGIAEWAKLRLDVKNECGGSFQSPINIIANSTIFDSSLGPVNYTHYHDALRNVLVENDGHTGERAILL
ncbi:hypothetical protein HPB50_000237 [Hyalomma asiaticum]|uniref:Uncharacterized protein n=1 Tax=Hyalomma asiaticum TaxID=266040 RepID=A0ACB7SAL4_HYAAI|nr:hypothetical protein HPB50_000237 [Hyalomma asiaticum]